jgi:hypothetical protein
VRSHADEASPGHTTHVHVWCGWVQVGSLYTDLADDGTGTGHVVYRRHAGTFFLSCAEVVFAAHAQATHPHRTRHSPTGRHGSRYVTVVATGDASGDVHLAAYQVSLQATALVTAGVVTATVEPAVMRVVEAGPTLAAATTDGDDAGPAIVPEVLFRYKNEYGADVTQAARPSLPVDFLLVNVRGPCPLPGRPPTHLMHAYMCANAYVHAGRCRSSLGHNGLSQQARAPVCDAAAVCGRPSRPCGSGRPAPAPARGHHTRRARAAPVRLSPPLCHYSHRHPKRGTSCVCACVCVCVCVLALALMWGRTLVVAQSDRRALLEVARTPNDAQAYTHLAAQGGWQTLQVILQEAAPVPAPAFAPVRPPARAPVAVNYEEQLALLARMGFEDRERNLRVLRERGGSLEDAIASLIG